MLKTNKKSIRKKQRNSTDYERKSFFASVAQNMQFTFFNYEKKDEKLHLKMQLIQADFF